MNRRFLLLLILTVLLLPVRVQGAITTIDGFNIYSSGSVTISGTGINAVAVQPWDRKIVIGGSFTVTSVGLAPQPHRTNLARLNFDGTLDTGFTADTDDTVYAIAIELDKGNPEAPGKILVGGNFGTLQTRQVIAGVPQPVEPVQRNGIARLRDADGYPDSFDPGLGAAKALVKAIAPDPSTGNIVFGGNFSKMAGTLCHNVVALASDGSFLSAFSDGVTDGVTDGEVAAILLQEGKTYVAGSFLKPQPYLVRFDAYGVRDLSFHPLPDKPVRALALQPDGSLILGGDFTSVTTPNFPLGTERLRLARLDGDGLLDGFDPGVEGPDASVAAVVMQPDGRILIGGNFQSIRHPSGAPVAGEEAVSRTGAARLRLDGAVDPSADPAPDAAVNAVALQPDGKFLIAGGFSKVEKAKNPAKPRTMLARFYSYGVLDEDVYPIGKEINQLSDQSLFFFNLSIDDDGRLAITTDSLSLAGMRAALPVLNPDWTVTDVPTNSPITVDYFGSLVLAPRLEGGFMLGGLWTALDGTPPDHAMQLTPQYHRDRSAAFNANFSAPHRLGSIANGPSSIIYLPDGRMYLGGRWYDEICSGGCGEAYNLQRVKPDGHLDESYTPPSVNGRIWVMALQPDQKLLVGTEYQLLRLMPDGKPDPDFTPYTFPGNSWADPVPYGVVLLPDGKILVHGAFEEYTPDPARPGMGWARYVVRLNSNGTLDNSFLVDVYGNDIFNWVHHVGRAHVQADGNILLTGAFYTVMGPTGDPVERHNVARISAAGVPDGLNLGAFTPDDRYEYDNRRVVDTSLLLPDGKLVLAGMFQAINGNTDRRHLARIAVGSATETLSVSADGQYITWKRGGAAPDASRVAFERWDEGSDGSGGSWRYIGEGYRIDGGWQIHYDLGQHGWNQNRYVRASAFLADDPGSGPLHRNVLLYYLRPEVTVQAKGIIRDYGSDNGTLEAEYLRDGVRMEPPPPVYGAVKFSTDATKFSPFGDYPISISLDNLSSPRYRFVKGSSSVSVSVQRIRITVTADPQTKLEGTEDPPLTYTPSRQPVPPDAFSGVLQREGDDTLGPHAITQGSLSLNPNYDLTYIGDFLRVYRYTQEIDFPAITEKTFGDSDFPLKATATSGFEVQFASSLSDVAKVLGSKVQVLAPGTRLKVATITASQPGDLYYAPAADQTQTFIINPPPGKALSFGSNGNLLEIPDAGQLRFDSKPGFTVELWLLLNGSQPDGTGILAKAGSGAGWRGFQLLLVQDCIAAQFGDGASTAGGSSFRGKNPLTDGKWHHVALSVDRSARSAVLYVDGKVEANLSDPLLGKSLDSGEPLRVGVERGRGSFFRGSIDELRLWDSARSQSDIRGAAGFILQPTAEPHLMAYYHFDEGSAGGLNDGVVTAPERTANGVNGNDGTLVNFALGGNESNWVWSKALLPLVDTGDFTMTGASTAQGSGYVHPNYFPITDVGVCWGPDPYPAVSDYCHRAGAGGGAFIDSIPNLIEPDTALYFRAFATNAMGTAFGNSVRIQAPGGSKQEQHITFRLPVKTYGDQDFPPGAYASSGLTVSYASSAPNIAAIVNGKIRILAAGSVLITASQGGDAHFNAAPDVACTLTIEPATISVGADYKARAFLAPNPPFTASYRGLVNGDSSLIISGSPALSTSATEKSPVGDYDIVVDVTPLYARNYRFVPVNGVLSVVKSCQQIIFPPLGDRTYGDPPYEVIAYSCSGLPIGFSSSDPETARIEGNLVTITGAGSTVITASQPGNGNTDGAPEVSQPLLVHRSRQELSFPELPRRVLGAPPFSLAARASSGLPVSYQSSDPGVVTIAGSAVTIVGPGTAVITAQQPGDRNYNPALPVSQPLTVVPEGDPPRLEVSTLSAGSVTANPVLNLTGSADDPSGIASLTVNDKELAGEANRFSTALALESGENSIKVSASDGFGNRSSRDIAVSFDAAAPRIEVREPADNSVTDTSYFVVRGSTTGSSVSVRLNGGAPQSSAVTEGNFSASGYLAEGLNTVEVTAELAGRSAALKRSVTLAFNKPYLAITDPPQDLRTEQDSLVLGGVAGGQVGEVSLLLEVDGNTTPLPMQGGAFRQEIPLQHDGETRIRVSATDGSGNSSTAQRNILKYQKVPGDLNGDGLVDIRDVLIALRISLGIEPVTPQALSHGDLAPLADGGPQPDGRIDVGDVLLLLRRVVGLVDF